MVNIPQLFRTKKIKILEEEIELKGYRVIDNELVVALQHKRNETNLLAVSLNQLANKKESEITEKDLKEIKNLSDDIDNVMKDIKEISYDLAQRGLKRFYYKDEPGFKEAEKDNKLTEYLDSLENIEIDYDTANMVCNTMVELGSPTEPLKDAGKGKPNQKAKKKS